MRGVWLICLGGSELNSLWQQRHCLPIIFLVSTIGDRTSETTTAFTTVQEVKPPYATDSSHLLLNLSPSQPLLSPTYISTQMKRRIETI